MAVILVTGGAGYIGSHACKALALAGHTPVVYDNLICGHRKAVRWGPLEVGDLLDRQRLDAVLAQYQPQAVLHFAAFTYVGESVEDPAKYYRNNVTGSLTLLEAMLANNISRLVFSSSCAVYGQPQTLPLQEQHPQQPISAYGASKAMIERMLQDFFRAYGLSSVALRYFNAAGADPENEVGEQHNPETHLIPLVLEVAAGMRSHITIYGDDYDTLDGTCVRDYIHVTDLAKAHVLALEVMEQQARAVAYNLGNGQGYSVKQIIDTAQTITAKEVPYQIGARRLGDPACLVAEPQKALEALAWHPHYTKLETMIETAWQWMGRA